MNPNLTETPLYHSPESFGKRRVVGYLGAVHNDLDNRRAYVYREMTEDESDPYWLVIVTRWADEVMRAQLDRKRLVKPSGEWGEDLRRLRGARVQHLALGATSNLNAPSRVLSFQVHQKNEPAQVKSRGSSAPSTDSSPMPQGI